MNNTQGSVGNVLAAICSFFVPGLGQLVQGRILAALVYFVASVITYWILIGFVIHLISIISAATYKGK